MPRERVYKIIERKVEKDGKTITRIYARSSYKGRDGRRHTLWRKGATRTEAKENLKKALDEIEAKGEESIKRSRSSFAELAGYYKTTYIIPAKYKGDMKTEGLRSHVQVASQLKPLVDFFGGMALKDITHEDIRLYKNKRLGTKYERGKDKDGKAIRHERSVASVNRELALLRKVLNVAISQRWLTENPFTQGDSLISLAGEVQRQRILTREEEERIFLACDSDTRRAHLKPILMCLMDTGMRRNEALRLTWEDVDLDAGTIKAISFKGTKRMERTVAMTSRLRDEIAMLQEHATGKRGELVFGVVGDIKRSWTTVRRIAGLEDVRLHDLRHQAATSFIKSGLSIATVGRLLGHRQPNTTYRYININTQDAIDAARAVDAMRAREEEKDTVN